MPRSLANRCALISSLIGTSLLSIYRLGLLVTSSLVPMLTVTAFLTTHRTSLKHVRALAALNTDHGKHP